MPLPSPLATSSLEALPMQLAVLDAEGEILYTNQAWRTFGEENGYVGESSSVGRNYLTVCDASGDAEANSIAGGIRAVVAGERDHFSREYPCHSPDQRRWFTMRASRFTHDDETYVQVVHLNITDRKLAELEADEKASRLRNVASILSHDLRNPLSVALGYAQTMLDDEMTREHLGRIVDALERMDDIVSDTLVLARQNSVSEWAPVELEAQAKSAWQHVETGDGSLVVVDSTTFEADPNLLSHLFENLYRNAVEHGSTGNRTASGDVAERRSASSQTSSDDAVEHGSTSSRSSSDDAVEHGSTGSQVPPDDAVEHGHSDGDTQITVTVGLLADTERTGFYVEDDGVGIPADEREAVFEDGYSSETDGTGLGLSIVSQVVAAHDWDIELTESASGGVRFEISSVELTD
ncbi:ATP-binding protein [Haloferax sp. YSMS24]|uniref:PAS domain-containing sensor histidine kinase n=1 Tax=Haloferax sp. YSMS24 TaxID=3388425 RepID=UPI00398CC171